MKQQLFEHAHQQDWQQLEAQLQTRKGEHEDTAAAFPHLYRQACQHLALARDRHYAPYLIQRLNRLVLQGHQRLYSFRQVGMLSHIGTFLVSGFPRLVRANGLLFGLAALLFFGPMIGMALGVMAKPELVYTLMDSDTVDMMEEMYDPEADHLGRNRDAQSDFVMFGFYIRNNTGIGFQTFAGGLLFGLGTIFYLVFNGLYIGAIAGHLFHVGYHEPFLSFVSGHSGLELTAIVLAGTSGLKLGLALVAPGRRRRGDALRQAAADSVPLVYGFAAMFLLAAFVEAFWSSNAALAPWIKYSVGSAGIALVAGYFLFAGRRHAT